MQPCEQPFQQVLAADMPTRDASNSPGAARREQLPSNLVQLWKYSEVQKLGHDYMAAVLIGLRQVILRLQPPMHHA